MIVVDGDVDGLQNGPVEELTLAARERKCRDQPPKRLLICGPEAYRGLQRLLVPSA